MAGHGPRVGRRDASRGQTETIGVVLVLAMTLIGATVALAFGGSVLNDARIDSQESGIEHAMTQLDSRAALVALGDSQTQRVPMAGTGSGGYHVDPDDGRIVVTHHDFNGSGDDEEIFNDTMGSFRYESGDKQIAYQGGGVWIREGNTSRMISPPEFHYRGATLTLPILRVEGGSGAGGSNIVAEITQVSETNRVFPDASQDYTGTSDPYVNPIREGNVTVAITSEYYEAWANYFRTRTTGEVTVDHANDTVTVKLIARGTTGNFEMPAEGNSIEIRGLGDGHPITEFNITIRPDDSDSANFANLQWSLYAEQGSQQFEIHLRKGNTDDDPDTPCTEVGVHASVYYSDSSGDPYHGWHQDNAFRTDCGDINGDGDNETFLEVDLVGNTSLTMESLSKSDLHHFNPSGQNKAPVNFSEHAGEPNADWEAKEFNDGDSTTIGNLTNHYLALMGPDVELTVDDQNSDTINEDVSEGTFEQTGGGGQFITFLHITENRISIELE